MKLAYLTEIFSPDKLAVDDCAEGLCYVRHHFAQASASTADILKLLSILIGNQCPLLLFEYILANDDEIHAIVRHAVSQQPPSIIIEDAATFNSVAARLQSFFNGIPAQDIRLPRDIVEVNEEAILLGSAVEGLSSIGHLFSDTNHQAIKDGSRQPKQKNTKVGLKTRAPSSTDKALESWQRVFELVGERLPRTLDESIAVRQRVVTRTRRIIIVYLKALKSPGIQNWVTSSYLKEAHGYIPSPTTNDWSNSAHSEPEKALAVTRRACFVHDADNELGDWHIEISSHALQTLFGYGKAVFSIAENKIQELSEGFFSESNQTKVAGGTNEIPIYQAYMTGDLRLVYQVECGPIYLPSGHVSSYDIQQIRILAICDHKQLARPIWAAIASQSRRKDPEHRRRCVHREIPRIKTKSLNTTPPAIFNSRPGLAENTVNPSDDEPLSDTDFMELHEILSLAKFIPYSRTLLETIQNSSDVIFPFSTSLRENEVICHPSSCVVIGRSGTGKTTTMMFRILDRELEAREKRRPIRQVFVTQSRFLAAKVEEYFRRLYRSLSPSHLSRSKERDPLGLDFGDNEDDSEDVTAPQRFSDLNESHFPLFITFDRLQTLIEREFEAVATTQQNGLHASSGFQRRTFMARKPNPMQKDFMTYEFFLASVWPHFNQTLKRRLDPALVFNEFMGVIMGSEASLDNPKGYLDRQTYEEQGKSNISFSKPRVYDLFELYLKARTQMGASDGPRRTRSILDRLRASESALTPLFDFLYVDEVQDNSIIDAQLLRALCWNPNGQVWCGDTAQTIAAGSSFRFDELRAFLHRAERKEPLVIRRKREPVLPERFELAVNYRSHGGIVNAAASLVSMMSVVFPNSIDQMSEEKALVPGPKPIFVDGSSEESSFMRFILGSEGGSPQTVSQNDGGNRGAHSGEILGAEQAILVRTEKARDELLGAFPEAPGLIFTVQDSKGLEFNDVILYDFFADSEPSNTDWRTAMRMFESRGNIHSLDYAAANRLASIQTELKCLYVGLTRARKRVWIWESTEIARPLIDWWLEKKLVVSSSFGEMSERVVFVRDTSTATQWTKQGVDLFNSGRYQHAAMCFARATFWKERDIALAFDLHRVALTSPSASRDRISMMRRAGASLKDCADASVSSYRKKRLHLRAAEAFMEGEQFAHAGKQFLDAEKYEDAAISYRKGGSFDEAIFIIENFKKHLSDDTVDSIIDLAKVHYARRSQMRKFQDLFKSDEDQLEFLDDLGLHDQKIKVIEQLDLPDKLEEMAKACFDKGDKVAGIKHLLESEDPESRKQAINMLWECIWDEFPLGRLPSAYDAPRVETLLELLKGISLDDKQVIHIKLVRMLLMTNHKALLDLGHELLGLGDKRAALLAFDVALQGFRERPLQNDSREDVSDFLNHFLAYSRLVHQMVVQSSIIYNRNCQSLLGLSQTSGNTSSEIHTPSVIQVLPHSVLFADLSSQHRKEPDLALNESQAPISFKAAIDVSDPKLLVEVLRKAFLRRLNWSLGTLHANALKCKVFRVCVPFAVLSQCRLNDLCQYQHFGLREGGPSIEAYNYRVRLHLQLVMVLNHLVVVDSSEGREGGWNRGTVQRMWLERCFETLNPPSYQIGSAQSIRPQLIKEFQEGMPVLRAWVQESFLGIAHPTFGQPRPWPFMTRILACSTLAFQLDPQTAIMYLPRGRWVWPGFIRDEFVTPIPLPDGTVLRRLAVENVFRWMSNFHPKSLEASAFFISHVVRSCLEIELNVFTHLIETVVAHIIRNVRSLSDGNLVRRDRVSGVLLPRSTFSHAISAGEGAISSAFTFRLIQDLGDFAWRLIQPDPGLKHLYTFLTIPRTRGKEDAGQDHGRGGDVRPDSNAANFMERSIIVSRLCRCLVLLAHNFNTPYWTKHVTDILSFRRMPSQTSTWTSQFTNFLGFRHMPQEENDLYLFHTVLVRPYVSAARNKDWKNIFQVLTSSMLKSPFDELVIAYDIMLKNPPAIPGVRAIRYNNLNDLDRTLSERSSYIMVAKQPGKGAAPKAIPPNTTVHPNGVPANTEIPDLGRGSNGDQDKFAQENTASQERACICIQRAFRRHRRYMISARSAPRCFAEYIAALPEVKNTFSPRYELRFLGVLPHVLAFVERVLKGLVQKKKKVNRDLVDASDNKFEDLRATQKTFSHLVRQAKAINSKLQPKSKLHVACTIRKLKCAVEEVVELREASEAVLGRMSTDEDYRLGVETLLRDLSRLSLKKKRPSLNTSDIY